MGLRMNVQREKDDKLKPKALKYKKIEKKKKKKVVALPV